MDLKESEKKALQELKLRVEEALKNNEFTEPPPKEAEATEAKEGTKEESKEEGAKETETKGEGDTKTPETKEEEVKGIVEDVKVVETITEIDAKVGEEEAKIEETLVIVTEKIEVLAHGDVPKHEETVVVSETKEESKEEGTKEEGAKATETKDEGYTKTSETKEEEIKGTVEDVKVVETITEIDAKVGEEEAKIEEIVVTVTEKIEVSAHGDVPKHEETVVVSKTVIESVVADSAPLAETSAVDNAKTPVEVTVTKETVEIDLQPVEDIYLWGVPLLHTHGDERTDVILLKFLQARDFKVLEAFTMLKYTILWRKRFGADSILEEDFGTEYDGTVRMGKIK